MCNPASSMWPLLWALLWAVPAVVRANRQLAIIAAVFLFAPLVNAGWLLVHYLAPIAAAGAAILLLLLARLGTRSIRGAFLAACIYLLVAGDAALTWKWWVQTPETSFERERS